MKEMNLLAKILYPDDEDNQDSASQEAGPVSSPAPAGRTQAQSQAQSQSQTQGNRHASDRASETTHSSSSAGGRRSSTGSSSNISTKWHPLHRDDPLYDAADAQEQVRIITERAQLMKDLKAATKNFQTQSQTQNTQGRTQSNNHSNTQSNTQGGSSSGAGASRRATGGRAAQSAASASAHVPLSQPAAPAESRRAANARLNPNGSSSSSQWIDVQATSSSNNATGNYFVVVGLCRGTNLYSGTLVFQCCQ